MIKDDQLSFQKLYVALDIVVILCSYVSAWFLIMGSPWSKVTIHNRQVMTVIYTAAAAFIVPLYLILYTCFHIYAQNRTRKKGSKTIDILKANTIGLLIISLMLYLGGKNLLLNNFSRPVLLLFFIINVILEIAAGKVWGMLLCAMYARGFNQKNILLVGYSRAAEEFIDRVAVNPEWGYKVYGILDDCEELEKEYKGVAVIGVMEQLPAVLDHDGVDEVAITLKPTDYADLEEIVAVCEKAGVHTQFIPEYFNMIPTAPYLENLQGLPVIHIRHVPLIGLFNRTVKRMMDLVGAVLVMILFSPIMLITALVIRVTSSGPVIFSQERVGLHNKKFNMYKFRSMEVQVSKQELWTKPGDARVTLFGRWIRKCSIDELPQIYNVLKGDMSLIGPRPERPFFVEQFKEEIPRYMIKHQVRPGMTGLAQVNGLRGDTSILKRIEYDLDYIENWTLGLDFKILALTLWKGFINKNAY